MITNTVDMESWIPLLVTTAREAFLGYGKTVYTKFLISLIMVSCFYDGIIKSYHCVLLFILYFDFKSLFYKPYSSFLHAMYILATEEEWGKHKCSHIPTQDTRKQCYIACRDQDESLANLLVCSKLKSVGMDWLAKEISQWLDSPICGNKDCHTSAHPLGSDLVQAKGTF
mmetsp:Transcript_14766/g.20923  ORF Transcript_14766/g.20923 Transcript_14766/m.20923 type:complete len:170 (-) Transcript_14766:293-802(-)